MTEQSIQDFAAALRAVAERMRDNGDSRRAGQMEELAAKLNSPHLEAAFCGHFSAGKSSLINMLCGHPLLPSSPIPTSANIVSISYGEEQVSIRRRSGESTHISLEQLDEACKNGEDIAEVHITYPHGLGERLILLDTPGIDSTDEAHELATRSVLHRADVVFYVMDYNHVQSELNFTFMKKLQEQGKPVYAVVNQIDKHRDRELPFEAYRASVEEAFSVWDLEPAGLFLISLKRLDHPHNEWPDLSRFVRSLPEFGQAFIRHNVRRSAIVCVEEHIDYLKGLERDERERLEEEMARVDVEDAAARLEALRREREHWLGKADEWLNEGKRELDKLLANANITPAKTRDLVHSFLESRQPGFRVGLLFAGGKTAAERQRRLEALLDDFQEQIRVHVQFHLADLLRSLCTQADIDPAVIADRLNALASPVDEAWLTERIQRGAVVSGEYTLNYSQTIAHDVKQYYGRQGLEMLEQAADLIRERGAREASTLEQNIARLEAEMSAWNRLRELDEELSERRSQFMRLLDRAAGGEADMRFPRPETAARGDSEGDRVHGTGPAAEGAAKGGAGGIAAADEKAAGSAGSASGSSEAPSAFVALEREENVRMRRRLTEAAELLKSGVDILEGIAPLKSLAAELKDKAERLSNQRFTIALFGAFSAGKSSFANALAGEPVLPVSPNPTTAAINRIVPPAEGWEHGSARVKLKSAERMEEELRHSLDMIGRSADSLEGLLELAAQIRPGDISPKARPHLSFLQAAARGWKELGGHLGEEWKVGLEQFREFAAVEQKSCFVERIDLHYACPLTDAGITLVDTPGADSINARHTGVAFEYIKNADAVLFVTYYNHAFSQADREFLNQLGRVKDSFELDKMFFVVNAADLAASREELEGVLRHVEGNLLQHGIRHPRLFALSSMLALDGKLDRDMGKLEQSGIVPFEERFYRFIYEDLADLIMSAARQDLSRAAARLVQWTDSARQGEAERLKALGELKRAIDELKPAIAEVELEQTRRQLRKEAEELVFYVRQRVRYRFGEFFQISFNPAVFRDGGPSDDIKLASAWKELVSAIGYDLSQEMLATTLRLEKHLWRLLDGRREQIVRLIRTRLPEFDFPALAARSLPTPAVEETMGDVPADRKWLSGYYKNARQFFEGGGRDRLKAALEEKMGALVSAFAERHLQLFDAYYGELLDELARELDERMGHAAVEYADGLARALEEGIDLDDLERRLAALERLRNQL
jgi:GTPase Era involved in 16S rRNA processing